MDGAPNTIIGGTSTDHRNIISGNGQASVLVVAQGIVLTGAAAQSGTQVQGNFIGTECQRNGGPEQLGYRRAGNRRPNNTIGGTVTGARNVISGNGIHGVEIDTAGATGNAIQGNHIGMDISGNVGLGNAGDGVFISNSPSNIVGGTVTAAANVISANGQAGVHILGIGASANTVQGNLSGRTPPAAGPRQQPARRLYRRRA